MVKIMEDNMTNTNVGVEGAEGTEQLENTETKTFTQEEVLKLIQSESDKRVSQALATQQKKYEKQLSLASLDETKRAEAEKDMRIQELQEQLAAFTIEKNRSELKSVLSSRGLSAEFADIININDNLEESQSNIDKLDRMFKAAVKAEVEKRLSGSTPKGNGGSDTGAIMTQEAFNKLPLIDQQKLLNQNKDFYSRFMG